MKKLIYAALAIILATSLLWVGSIHFERAQNAETGTNGNKVLNLYNWGDYIDPALITKFEKQTGIKVNYETFDSNEAMVTKIKQGGTSYDLTVPSDYMIQKMKKENLLLPIDKSKITTLKYIDKRFLNLAFDRHNKYSIPYFWGTLGIVYNDKYVKRHEISQWNDLWNSKYRDKIMLIDSARDILGLSLISQGNSLNDKSSADLQAAKGKLDALMPNVKAIVADEIKMYMVQEEAPIAVTYSGEAAEMIAQNKHLHYIVPTKGSNEWFDNLVIPKTAKHIAAAYQFINFINQPENAKQNAEYIGYATPNAKAKQLLPKSIRTDQQFYPSAETLSKLQVYQDLGQKKTQEYNDLFLEFKMTNR